MDASMMRTPFCRLLHFFGGTDGCYGPNGRAPHASLMLVAGLDGGNQLRTDAMDLTLKDDASKTFAVVLKDKLGVVAQASGALSVASSDESIVTATLSSDGQSVDVAAAGAGKLGTATVTVSDEADSVSAVVNVTVVAGSPASIELTEAVAASTSTATATDSTAADASGDATATTSAAADAGAATDASVATDAAPVDAAASTDATVAAQ
jgi:hypothetical protein